MTEHDTELIFKLKETNAKRSVDTPSKLVCRLLQTKNVLKKELASKFIINTKTVDFNNKRVLSTDKTLVLQWQLRNNPNMPESYENQQTTTGKVYLYKI